MIPANNLQMIRLRERELRRRNESERRRRESSRPSAVRPPLRPLFGRRRDAIA